MVSVSLNTWLTTCCIPTHFSIELFVLTENIFCIESRDYKRVFEKKYCRKEDRIIERT